MLYFFKNNENEINREPTELLGLGVRLDLI